MRWGPTGLELLKLTKDAFQLGLDGFQLGCNLVVAHLCCDNASGRSKQEKDATKGSAGSLFLDALPHLGSGILKQIMRTLHGKLEPFSCAAI